MDKLLHNIRDYFVAMRLYDGFLIIDMVFPSSWSVEDKYGDVVVKLNDMNDKSLVSLSFYCGFTEGSINTLLTAVNQAVQHNMEEELKKQLLQRKIQEMESLFKGKNLDELTKLTFTTNEPKSEPANPEG